MGVGGVGGGGDVHGALGFFFGGGGVGGEEGRVFFTASSSEAKTVLHLQVIDAVLC